MKGPGPEGPNHISEQLGANGVSLLRKMILIRELEQRTLDLSQTTPPQVVGSAHLCAGQEAVPVGTIAGLNESDQIVATYRGHGWALSSGLPLLEVLGEICHRHLGINGGRGGSAYMMAPDRRFIGENSIVGAGVPHARGRQWRTCSRITGKLSPFQWGTAPLIKARYA